MGSFFLFIQDVILLISILILSIFDTVERKTPLTMKKLLVTILSAIVLFACKQSNKQIDEQQLLGTWETIEGFDFEEITFSIEDDDSRVISLVYAQRANLGNWRVEDDNLVIESDYDTLLFSDVQFSADTLILVQKSGVSSVFIRKTNDLCNATSLLKMLKDVSKIEFSEILDTTLDDGEEATYMSLPLEITDDFSVMGKAIAPLVNELPGIGFELDNDLITETQTGYFFKNHKLIITNRYISPLPGSEQNSTDEGDISGIYEVLIICYCN